MLTNENYQKVRKTCTTILVGKKASIDGSTMIARNEDGGEEPNPQRFVIITPEQQPRHYQSSLNTLSLDLPANPLQYSSTPDASSSDGIWAAGGINSANVAMTATETSTTNPQILAFDPFVEDGIGEADITTLVLPYIHSARAGVERLGALLEEFGTYESNGIAFSDQDEVWYFETIGGHHWAAIKIPDDAYVIAPNRFNIDFFDPKAKNTLCSADLETFVIDNNLNPDANAFNLRHIFGSASDKDIRYNNPRAWYVQKYLTPEIKQLPEDQDLPFINYSQRKISPADIKYLLSSHYQNTPYDPYKDAAEANKYRSIGLNRNQEVHILQLRPLSISALVAVHWLAYGPNPFNELVPFYASVADTPLPYRDTSADFSTDDVYWLVRIIAVIGDSNYALYHDMIAQFAMETLAACLKLRNETDQTIMQADGINSEQILTDTNAAMAALYLENTRHLLNKMVKLASAKMKLHFNLND